MDREFRNAIIKATKEFGGRIRQLSRLAGLSYSLIVKHTDYEQINSAHRNRPCEFSKCSATD